MKFTSGSLVFYLLERESDVLGVSDEHPSSVALFLPEDFEGNVRFTDDGRVSVYDAIGFTTGHKNPRQVWNDLVERDSLFVQKTDK